jgi:hypothetical protein
MGTMNEGTWGTNCKAVTLHAATILILSLTQRGPLRPCFNSSLKLNQDSVSATAISLRFSALLPQHRCSHNCRVAGLHVALACSVILYTLHFGVRGTSGSAAGKVCKFWAGTRLYKCKVVVAMRSTLYGAAYTFCSRLCSNDTVSRQ